MRIDIHSHFVPPFLLDEAARDPDRYGISATTSSGQAWLQHREGYRYPATDVLYKGSAMVGAMDRLGLDGRVMSLVPTLYFDHLPKEVQVGFQRRANQFAAELVRSYRGRIWAMGTVPLPHLEESLQELEHIRSLGLVGVEIAGVIAGRHLDDALFRPFFSKAADLGLAIFVHPGYLGPKPGLEEFYFVNTIGIPLETLICAARLLHSGLLRDLPHLRVLLAHGGGFFPYQRGRFQHAWKVRPEPKAHIDRPPLEYAGALHFDSITHDPLALRFLIDAFGPDKVLMGSDFPFDMGVDDVVANVAQAQLPGQALRQVQGENAIRLFNLSHP